MAIDFSFPPEIDALRLQGPRLHRRRSCARPRRNADADDWDRDDWIQPIIEMRGAAHEWGLWLPHMPKEWGGMGLGHVAMAGRVGRGRQDPASARSR